MRQNRCWFLAAFLCAVALSQFDAQSRREAVRPIGILSVGATTRAQPMPRLGVRPRPFEAFTLSQSLRDSIVALALSQLGTPYIIGGTTPHRGFDCSGLVKYVVSQVHMTLPRTANMQAQVGAPIDRSRLEPGDLLAFGEGRRISHIGIYVGGGKFVHASSIARRVIISPLDRKPTRLIRPMQGARRLLATADPLSHTGG